MNKQYQIILLLLAVVVCACHPEAKWTKENVKIEISVETISAAFIECRFSTDIEGYYLIGIDSVKNDYDPMSHQKQFMMLALDDANVEYIVWRNQLLQNGEFNVAPFASHSLQYGKINHFFTGLKPETDYWIYAFSVNPETLTPMGTLQLITVQTAAKSVVDINFEYRVIGEWDYIYPIEKSGKIHSHFPYIATTRDSIDIAQDNTTPQEFFTQWTEERFRIPELAEVYYGVRAIENDGISSYLQFEQGHTYYTCISGYDGTINQMAIYKFTWKGDSTYYYFKESDSANIYRQNP